MTFDQWFKELKVLAGTHGVLKDIDAKENWRVIYDIGASPEAMMEEILVEYKLENPTDPNHPYPMDRTDG